MEKWVVIFAAACFLVAMGFGITCMCAVRGMDKNDDDMTAKKLACVISLTAVHGVFVVLATVFLCLYSAKTSLWCGILFAACAFVLFCIVSGCSDERYGVRLGVTIMIFEDIACAAGGLLNTYAYFWLWIICFVLLIVALINLFVAAFKYEYAWDEGCPLTFNIINIFFAVLIAAGLTVGLCLYFLPQEEIDVSIDTALYRYSDYSELGEQIAEGDNIYFNESCALQVELKFDDLHALSASSKELKVFVTFPSDPVGGVTYIADGVEFKEGVYQDTKRKFWLYTGTLNVRSDTQLKSGYFVFKYSAETLESLASKIDIRVRISDEKSTDGEALEWHSNQKIRYSKHEYEFGEGNHLKDLSVSAEGRYLISYPAGCNAFQIMIRDVSGKGVYYDATITNADGDKNYLLDIPALLEANVDDGIYASLVDKRQTVSVEITALESSNYYSKSVAFEYSFGS